MEFSRVSVLLCLCKALVCEHAEAIGVCRRHGVFFGLCSGLNEDTSPSFACHCFPSLSESIRSAKDNGWSFKCLANCWRVFLCIHRAFISIALNANGIQCCLFRINFYSRDCDSGAVLSWSREFKHMNPRPHSAISKGYALVAFERLWIFN